MRRCAVAVAVAALVAVACAGAVGPRGPAAPQRDAGALPAADTIARRPERVVLVALPGLAPEHYLPPPGVAPLAPTLAALAAGGVAVESLAPVYPPATLPALVSLASGAAPVRHGALSPSPLDDAGIGAPRAIPASALGAGTLWQAVTASGAGAAAFDWPGTDGSAVAQPVPGGADAAPGPARDAALVDAACALVSVQSPLRLLGVHLMQAEVARLVAPPGSRAARAAIAGADAELARLVACLRRAGRLETTAIVVSGDHGVVPVHTALRPNVRLVEVGLVTLARTGGTQSWRAIARSYGGGAFVYAGEAEDALLARRALEEAAAETGAFRVVSAQEMLARGADPQAWFGLDAVPGWVFEDAASGPFAGPASQRAAGGYAPGEPRMATGLVAWGAGVRAGVQVPALREIDVAPTLAKLLGVALPDAEGRALVGALAP